MSESLQAPKNWDRYEDSRQKWFNIRLKEVVYSDLPQGAEDAIEDFVTVARCKGRDIERVGRTDAQTVEIVWYDDAGTEQSPDDFASRDIYEKEREPTYVPEVIIQETAEVLQGLFGEQWRVTRKPDERRSGGTSQQRALVRRVDHQRFAYQDETVGEYKLNLHGRPENAPEGAEKFGDLDDYPEPPRGWNGDPEDLYCYTTGTGTVHLITSIRDEWIAEDLSCECGLGVQARDIVDATDIEHYAEVLMQKKEDGELSGYNGDHGPESCLGEDLCGRCWKSYAEKDRYYDGRVRDYAPPAGDSQYATTLSWMAIQPDQ